MSIVVSRITNTINDLIEKHKVRVYLEVNTDVINSMLGYSTDPVDHIFVANGDDDSELSVSLPDGSKNVIRFISNINEAIPTLNDESQFIRVLYFKSNGHAKLCPEAKSQLTKKHKADIFEELK